MCAFQQQRLLQMHPATLSNRSCKHTDCPAGRDFSWTEDLGVRISRYTPEGGEIEDTGVVRDVELPGTPASMDDPLVSHDRGAAVRLEGRRGTLCVYPNPLQGGQIKLPHLRETEQPLMPCRSRIIKCMQVVASRALLQQLKRALRRLRGSHTAESLLGGGVQLSKAVCSEAAFKRSMGLCC